MDREAVLLALRQVLRAERLRAEALEDFGEALRAARAEMSPDEFAALLREARDAGLAPGEIATALGVSIGRYYQLLERRSSE